MQQWHTHESALEWDAGGSEQLATRKEQQEIMLALLAATSIGDGAVLDLGVGSGLVAEAVLERLPEARLVGIDFSPSMLDLARRRLARFGSRATLIRGDLSQLDHLEVPRLPYRAAISVQTLHHLSRCAWAAAARWTAEQIQPGGLILIVDRYRSPRRSIATGLLFGRASIHEFQGHTASTSQSWPSLATGRRVFTTNCAGCVKPDSTPIAIISTAIAPSSSRAGAQ